VILPLGSLRNQALKELQDIERRILKMKQSDVLSASTDFTTEAPLSAEATKSVDVGVT
jgi:hypothetical protein